MASQFIPVLGEIVSATLQESWGRYFVLLSTFAVSSFIQSFTGIGFTTLINFVVQNVFGVVGFNATDFQIMILIAISPVVFYLLKLALQPYSN